MKERASSATYSPFLVGLLQFLRHNRTPPFELWRGALLGKYALDEASVKVESGDLGGGLWLVVDAVKARALGAEGGSDPTERGLGRGGTSLVEYGKDWG